jgi:hypothetical protein
MNKKLTFTLIIFAIVITLIYLNLNKQYRYQYLKDKMNIFLNNKKINDEIYNTISQNHINSEPNDPFYTHNMVVLKDNKHTENKKWNHMIQTNMPYVDYENDYLNYNLLPNNNEMFIIGN